MFIGQGELEEDVRNLVNAKKLQENVLFLGLRTDVPACFKQWMFLCYHLDLKGWELYTLKLKRQV